MLHDPDAFVGIVLIVAKGLQVIVHHHGAQGDCDGFVKVHDAANLPVVLPAANQRVGTDHERDAAGFLPHLALVYGPAEHVGHINDIRKLTQKALICQRRHGHRIVYEQVAVSAGQFFVAIPTDKFDLAHMARRAEALFQKLAEPVRIGQIIIIIHNDGRLGGTDVFFPFHVFSPGQ